MNCLLVCESRLWIATLVFYTCVLIPLRQLKNAVSTLFCGCNTKDKGKQMEWPEIPLLPATTYNDLHLQTLNSDHDCSICLVEFGDEDLVTKLPTCGHVFHLNCIDGWLHSNHFTCPLCRSFLFSGNQ